MEVTPLGPVPVKGLPEPVEIYELRQAGRVRSRLQAAVARGLTHFVGRGPELEQLHQALSRAAAGHGRVVAGVGEPGVGKSRLFYEFTRSPTPTAGCCWPAIRCPMARPPPARPRSAPGVCWHRSPRRHPPPA